MQTTFTELLNIAYPIIQAPIGSATNPLLASEVSNAGGLGTLALSWKNPAECRSMIQETKKLTVKPFAVNLVLDIDQEERIQICIEEKVPIVWLFWANPSPYVERLKSEGIIVCTTVASSAEAREYEAAGVDFMIAQGWEAGGHVKGTVASSVLLAAITEKVSIPVIASGGFTDGRGLVAALALGASGISIGTGFLMSKEAAVADEYRQLISQADENSTVITDNLYNKGWENAPHRVLRNSTVNAWETAGKPEVGKRPGEQDIIAHDATGNPIERYSDNNPIKGVTGNLEAMALYAGQSAGIAPEGLTAKETILHIMQQANQTLNKLKEL
jgi:nitronate monooxygenase